VGIDGDYTIFGIVKAKVEPGGKKEPETLP
jgi:hypothetical protein